MLKELNNLLSLISELGGNAVLINSARVNQYLTLKFDDGNSRIEAIVNQVTMPICRLSYLE